MKCPIDSADLVMTERQGVEIDYCPTCRGVWLDRGELDKIIERSEAATPQASSRSRQDASPLSHHSQPDHDRRDHSQYDHHRRSEYEHDDHKHDPRYKKRRSSFLGDMFDFGD